MGDEAGARLRGIARDHAILRRLLRCGRRIVAACAGRWMRAA